MVLAFKCLSEGVALERWSARQSRNLTRVKGQIRRIEYLNSANPFKLRRNHERHFQQTLILDGDEDLKRLMTKDVTLKVAHIEYAHKRLAFIMQASVEK